MPNVIEVLGDADRLYRRAINDDDKLGVIAFFRFVAVMDRDRIVLSLSGTPTQTQLDALGDRASSMAEAMRLCADALDPPGLVERLADRSPLDLDPLGPMG